MVNYIGRDVTRSFDIFVRVLEEFSILQTRDIPKVIDNKLKKILQSKFSQEKRKAPSLNEAWIRYFQLIKPLLDEHVPNLSTELSDEGVSFVIRLRAGWPRKYFERPKSAYAAYFCSHIFDDHKLTNAAWEIDREVFGKAFTDEFGIAVPVDDVAAAELEKVFKTRFSERQEKAAAHNNELGSFNQARAIHAQQDNCPIDEEGSFADGMKSIYPQKTGSSSERPALQSALLKSIIGSAAASPNLDNHVYASRWYRDEIARMNAMISSISVEHASTYGEIDRLKFEFCNLSELFRNERWAADVYRRRCSLIIALEQETMYQNYGEYSKHFYFICKIFSHPIKVFEAREDWDRRLDAVVDGRANPRIPMMLGLLYFLNQQSFEELFEKLGFEVENDTP